MPVLVISLLLRAIARASIRKSWSRQCKLWTRRSHCVNITVVPLTSSPMWEPCSDVWSELVTVFGLACLFVFRPEIVWVYIMISVFGCRVSFLEGFNFLWWWRPWLLASHQFQLLWLTSYDRGFCAELYAPPAHPSPPPPLSLQAFDLTSMWYCVD